MDAKTAIILENFGGPSSAEEVEAFLFNLFSDPDVVRLPLGSGLRRVLARWLSRRRAPRIIPAYETIGGSPLTRTTLAQAGALGRALAAHLPEGARPTIHIGMRYTAPFIDEAVGRALDAGAERLIALPLFPHYSGTTTGSVHNALVRALERRGRRFFPVTFVPAFFAHPDYLDAITGRIEDRLGEAPPATDPDDPGVHLLFSAHGLPSRYVRHGDPYPGQVRESVRLMVDRLGWAGSWSLSWQSRVGPVRWLGPATDAEIVRLAEVEGVRRMIVAPISFVGDHIETLFELGHTYRRLATARGIRWFRVTRGLDTHAAFIRCLADIALQADAGAFDRLCPRCLIPRERAHLSRARCFDCHVERPYWERVWRTRQDRDRGL